MNTRIERIRREEREYHEQCFENYKLYQKGSWLHKPVAAVMNHAELLDAARPLTVLDLGCGVGRNSIPLAEIVQPAGGKVICVDLLDTALDKLEEYGEKYEVDDALVTVKQDISDFTITPGTYDYIIACSSLEHVRSEAALHKVLQAMVEGTRPDGINCVVMHTNIEEYDIPSGERRETFFEVIKTRDYVLNLLSRMYDGWERLHLHEEPLELEITRGDDPVLLKADSVTIAVRKHRLA
ncbi:class I SAM-dependent methyltransferase [Paenibacillus gansuensis]|uniref:Class I SAM-dependent methyltransferase n=1 Tax=Paenibacillus gansuensis TaxID=306542 RepID=A0ABW5PIX2_9BACL